MTLAGLIVLVLIAGLFRLFKWRRFSLSMYILSAILFLAIGCGPIPTRLLENLQSTYKVKPEIEWGQRNAIVLLGAGTTKITAGGTPLLEPGTFAYARLMEAAGLYHDCLKIKTACKIIVSGGDPQHHGMAEAVIYKEALTRIGISPTDIVPESNSLNTWQNAQFTSAILKTHDADRVLLVSASIHLRRSMLYFMHFGVSAIPVRGDYLQARLSVIPLSYNFTVADFALHEYLGIARYYIYNALEINPTRTTPGEA